jgi:glyoxylase-like metal-dependent hydrolase (beta-lactamase superfamily II)
MNLHSINSGYFKLDGGAMFGVVPKSIWESLNPADENNMCSWAMRCLLIEDGNRLILIDNGLGDKQDKKFFGYYYLHGDDSLEKSLRTAGFSMEDITDVFLTHLHFDHCGGSIKWNKDRTGYETAFKKATYWSHKEHWEWATKPNAREKASFLKENIFPIQESGQLKFVEGGTKEKENEILTGTNFSDNISLFIARGHTDAMMLPMIPYKNKTVVYVADLLPCTGHIPVPYVMAYDTRPLITLEEKAKFLNTAAEKDFIFFFEHDPVNECCSLEKTDRGVRMKQKFKLNTL